ANNTAAGATTVVRPSVGVISATVRVPESAGQLLLPIALSPANPFAPVTVTYTAVDGTAAPNSDCTPAGNAPLTVTIAAGTPGATIPITIIDEADVEGV